MSTANWHIATCRLLSASSNGRYPMSDPKEKTGEAGTGDSADTGGDASTSIAPDAAELPPASGLDVTLGADLEPADEPLARNESGSNVPWAALALVAALLLIVFGGLWLLGNNGNQPATVVQETVVQETVTVIDPDSHLVLDHVHVAGNADYRGELFASADGKRFLRCLEIDRATNGNPAPVRETCVDGVAGR